MKAQILFLACLTTVGAAAGVSNRRGFVPNICGRPKGVYDVCDTQFSFIRCNGHEAMLVTDCRVSESNYCRVIHGKGRCDGTAPPDLTGEFPSCETDSPSVSVGST